mmetsp:Transcript_23372/g.49461  ORF Transcript_23372/g.49461 Transcript_23372/m.49461 type:complete len:264 (-) Transcript_23372:85-876(-)
MLVFVVFTFIFFTTHIHRLWLIGREIVPREMSRHSTWFLPVFLRVHVHVHVHVHVRVHSLPLFQFEKSFNFHTVFPGDLFGLDLAFPRDMAVYPGKVIKIVAEHCSCCCSIGSIRICIPRVILIVAAAASIASVFVTVPLSFEFHQDFVKADQSVRLLSEGFEPQAGFESTCANLRLLLVWIQLLLLFDLFREALVPSLNVQEFVGLQPCVLDFLGGHVKARECVTDRAEVVAGGEIIHIAVILISKSKNQFLLLFPRSLSGL